MVFSIADLHLSHAQTLREVDIQACEPQLQSMSSGKRSLKSSNLHHVFDVQQHPLCIGVPHDLPELGK